MARKPSKPWFRSDRNAWFVCLHGKQVNLGPDKREAERRMHELLAQKPDTQVSHAEGLAVAEVIDKYLEWCHKHRAAETFSWYLDRLQSFLDFVPHIARQPVTALKPFHVIEWADKHSRWGNSYRRGAIIAIQRPFNWAMKLGYIDTNPLRFVEKPQASRRDNPMALKDFSELLSHVKDQEFRDLFTFAWLAGTRPQEARHIEARHVNFDQTRIEIPPDEAKGKKRWRLIYLNDQALAIIKRLATLYPKGKLFRNTEGNPWKTYTLCSRFQSLKEKTGKRFAAYDARHGFTQRLLEAGANHLVVAELLGHVNGNMVSQTYQHMNKADNHLRETIRKA